MLEALSKLWKDSLQFDHPPQLVISKCKCAAASKALERFDQATARLNLLAEALRVSRDGTQQARELVSTSTPHADGSSGTLSHAHTLQRARDDLKSRLSACIQFKELLILSDADVSILAGEKVEPLSCIYFLALQRLITKQANALKVLKYLERNAKLTFPLSECLTMDPAIMTGKEVADPLPVASVRVASELDELSETIFQKLFRYVVMWSCNLLQYFVGEGVDKRELLSLLFDRSILHRAATCPFPDAEEAKAPQPETGSREDAYQKILHFYRGILVLHSKPRFFVQCIRSVAHLRAVLLRTQFNDALEFGIKIIDRVDDVPIRTRMLSADTTSFFGNVLAWVHQAVRDECEFVTDFMDSLPSMSEFVDIADEADLGTVNDMVNYILQEGLMADLHAAFRPYLPFKTEDLGERLAQVDRQMSAADLHKLTQAILPDPVPIFDLIHMLDFYLMALPRRPCLVSYLVHLREGFFHVFKAALEARAIALQDVALEEVLSSASTPPFVIQTVKFMRSLLQIFEQQIIIANREESVRNKSEVLQPEDDRIVEFNDILNRTYTPVINLCRSLADRLPANRASVISLNSWSYMLASLRSPKELQTLCPCYKHLELLVEEAFGKVVQAQVEHTLEKLGLSDLNSVTDAEITGALLRLYTAFTGPSGTATFQLVSKVMARSLRARVRRSVLGEIGEIYERLYARLDDECMLKHPDEVKALLMADL